MRDHVSDVEGDIDETTLKERGMAVEDLESAKIVWEGVEVLGRDFQKHGGLLAADESKLNEA